MRMSAHPAVRPAISASLAGILATCRCRRGALLAFDAALGRDSCHRCRCNPGRRASGLFAVPAVGPPCPGRSRLRLLLRQQHGDCGPAPALEVRQGRDPRCRRPSRRRHAADLLPPRRRADDLGPCRSRRTTIPSSPAMTDERGNGAGRGLQPQPAAAAWRGGAEMAAAVDAAGKAIRDFGAEALVVALGYRRPQATIRSAC